MLLAVLILPLVKAEMYWAKAESNGMGPFFRQEERGSTNNKKAAATATAMRIANAGFMRVWIEANVFGNV